MKKIVLPLFAFFIMANAMAQTNWNTVNAVIGDISYIQKFEQAPDESTNETVRLQTHLSYVEELLAHKDVSYLPEAQKRNRAKIIQTLHQYWTNGVFPKNYDYEERRPCFIDRDGAICAVGYLIEQTAGREVAEEINAKHQYDYLLDMNEKVIEQWANEYGLTLEECAMIQPSYGYYPPVETKAPIEKDYGIASGFAMGVNAGMNVFNLANRFKGANKNFCFIGLATGITQVALGINNIKEDKTQVALVGASRITTFKAQNNLSYANIAMGTTTILTSAFNLIINSKAKDKRNAFNLYSYPDLNNKVVAGLAFTRSL